MSRHSVGSRIAMVALASLILLMLVTGASAHSVRPPPLRRVHHPSRSTVRIVPRGGGGTVLTPRSLFSPPSHDLRHDDTLLLTATVPSIEHKDVALLLRPAEHLFHPEATITYASGGQTPLRAQDWRMYQGDVVRPAWIERVWSEEMAGIQHSPEAFMGRASVMVHESGDSVRWEGSFTAQGLSYQVMRREKYEQVKKFEDADVAMFGSDLVVFSNDDMGHDIELDPEWRAAPTNSSMCGHDNLEFNMDPFHPARKRRDVLFARDDTGGMTPETNYIDYIGSNEGCPKDPQIVYVGVALDCNYVQHHGGTEPAREQVLNNFNSITTLYRSTFNISIGIIHINVQDGNCPSSAPQDVPWNVNCSDSITLNDRLSTFSKWRNDQGDDGAGLWHLMTNCATDSEIGVAWLGTICSQGSRQSDNGQHVSGTGVSSAAMIEWNVVSHEMGHNFGAIHDCSDGCSLSGQCCPYSRDSCSAGGQFIMNPTTAEDETQFSQCTLGNICNFIGMGSKSCIMTPDGRTTLGKNQCGNGIVEAGEECDPGGNGATACCTADCKLTEGSQCDPTNSMCCTSSCQVAAAGTVCRASVDATCDMEEVCNGNNATCPEDQTAKDGTGCGNGLACANGHCTSNSLQCQQAGKSLGLTKACPTRGDETCYVSCETPNVAKQCTILQTVLIDGSPCGYGGHCYRGKCNPGSWQEKFKALYTSNLSISIPVTVVVGLLIIAILYGILRCCCNCCYGSGRRKPPPTRAPPGATSYMAPYPRPDDGYRQRDSRQQPLLDGPEGHRHHNSGSFSDEVDPGMPMVREAYNDPYAAGPGGYGAAPQAYSPPGQRGPHNGWVDETMYNGRSDGMVFQQDQGYATHDQGYATHDQGYAYTDYNQGRRPHAHY